MLTDRGAFICEHGRQKTICGECFPSTSDPTPSPAIDYELSMGGPMVCPMCDTGGPSPRQFRASLVRDRDKLLAAIMEHWGQKADDRCWMDDDKLYAAAGLQHVDRRVGDKAAMLKNCERFVGGARCEPGGWPTYADLEREVAALRAERDALKAQLPRGMAHCTILFKECGQGHGWLVATHWDDHGCDTCELDALKARLAERDTELMEDARRYDDAVQPLQRRAHEYIVRAEAAEARLAEAEKLGDAMWADIRDHLSGLEHRGNMSRDTAAWSARGSAPTQAPATEPAPVAEPAPPAEETSCSCEATGPVGCQKHHHMTHAEGPYEAKALDLAADRLLQLSDPAAVKVAAIVRNGAAWMRDLQAELEKAECENKLHRAWDALNVIPGRDRDLAERNLAWRLQRKVRALQADRDRLTVSVGHALEMSERSRDQAIRDTWDKACAAMCDACAGHYSYLDAKATPGPATTKKWYHTVKISEYPAQCHASPLHAARSREAEKK